MFIIFELTILRILVIYFYILHKKHFWRTARARFFYILRERLFGVRRAPYFLHFTSKEFILAQPPEKAFVTKNLFRKKDFPRRI